MQPGAWRRAEPRDVVRRAADVFWEKGFKAASVSDIVRATGLNTASMYKEFGDKEGLFGEALDYYRSQVMGPRFGILTESPNLQGVEAFLASVAKGAAGEGYRGCLMMNHLAQTHAISSEAADKIGEFCGAMEHLLERALRNAQAEGDLPDDRDPAALASYVMCCVHGLVLYGRHPNKKVLIPGVYETVLRAIRA
jgi:TetR/AcrR family transcriptional repressor of nem operon